MLNSDIVRPNYRCHDTDQLDWEQDPTIRDFNRKLLYLDAETGADTLLRYFPPGARYTGHGGGRHRHYHLTVRQRAFALYGDFPHCEFKDPLDIEGNNIVFRRGYFMDRPPRSIHGTQPEPLSQSGAVILQWNTGGGVGLDDPKAEVETVSVPFEGDLQSMGKNFPEGRVFDTSNLAWQPHPTVPGWKRKVLATPEQDDEAVSLLFVPPEWRPGDLPARGAPSGDRSWLFVLSGDLPLWVYDTPEATPGECVSLREGTYLEWSQPAVVGFEAGPGSEIGCTLLCVGHELIA